ncbi:B-cell differentiation antigen CD72 [Pseudonaja textilis]|uniref:B-cell differentiation antigen CD72 n=1 Tax=Pseudonaja textilis TaxID=8673 RepID=UPI000EA89866|nr:B-cell differentiation antigen CD72 [Pseudonaja textilis]
MAGGITYADLRFARGPPERSPGEEPNEGELTYENLQVSRGLEKEGAQCGPQKSVPELPCWATSCRCWRPVTNRPMLGVLALCLFLLATNIALGVEYLQASRQLQEASGEHAAKSHVLGESAHRLQVSLEESRRLLRLTEQELNSTKQELHSTKQELNSTTVALWQSRAAENQTRRQLQRQELQANYSLALLRREQASLETNLSQATSCPQIGRSGFPSPGLFQGNSIGSSGWSRESRARPAASSYKPSQTPPPPPPPPGTPQRCRVFPVLRWQLRAGGRTGAGPGAAPTLPQPPPARRPLAQSSRLPLRAFPPGCCPRGWTPFRWKCLRASSEEKTWAQSRWDCKAASSQLLILRKPWDAPEVWPSASPERSNHYWVGLKKSRSSFFWVDRSPGFGTSVRSSVFCWRVQVAKPTSRVILHYDPAPPKEGAMGPIKPAGFSLGWWCDCFYENVLRAAQPSKAALGTSAESYYKEGCVELHEGVSNWRPCSEKKKFICEIVAMKGTESYYKEGCVELHEGVSNWRPCSEKKKFICEIVAMKGTG